jgi:hypothetical protein
MTFTSQQPWKINGISMRRMPVKVRKPTSLSFSKNPLLNLDGKVKEEGKLEQEYDKNFGSTLKFYSNKVSFVQRVKLKSAVATVVKGSINYMVCNDKKCLPPKEYPFYRKSSRLNNHVF